MTSRASRRTILPDTDYSVREALQPGGESPIVCWIHSSPQEEFSRVEEGRWTGTYWQPVVSLPRSSNRICGFPASGSPTDFTTGSRKSPKVHIPQPQHPQRPEYNCIRVGKGAAGSHLVSAP